MSLTETNEIPKIPGYDVLGVLGSGATSVVYRALRGGKDFALKVSPAGRNEGFLRQEAAALARIEHRGVVKVHEAGEEGRLRYLAMEFIDGPTLDAVLESGIPSSDQLLRWAKTLTSALTAVHARGLVHRDIKPANVIVSEDDVKLIDFGFVGTVDTKLHEDGIVGTFLYGAPEQIGILEHDLDERTDLYSLGAVLYECATGQPPYPAESVSELLSMQTSVVPRDPSELVETVDRVFGQIVMRLIAKDPDDRYQSSYSLLWDLEHLTDLHDELRTSGAARLGRRDHELRTNSDIPMVGRGRDLAKARKALADSKSSGVVLVVEGEPGSGKSRLLSELTDEARSQGALILGGKAQKTERVPFGPLREALDRYILRATASDRHPDVAEKFRAAATVPAVVRRLTPSLDALFGDAPDVAPLDPSAEQERFYDKVADFFANLATEFGQVVLLIDDVQWLDDGSMNILKRTIQRITDGSFLLATSARNDPESEEGRRAFVDAVPEKSLRRIRLRGLDQAAVEELLEAYLSGRVDDDGFAATLTHRTKGNPFAVGQYVRAMLDQGGLRPAHDGWRVDEEALAEIVLSSDVISLLVGRLHALGDDTLDVLRAGAIQGFAFESDLLAAGSTDPSRVRTLLGEAARANLIERTGPGEFAFVHDRVQEAVLSDVDDRTTRRLNQAAAEALEAQPEDRRRRYVFQLARHYSRGELDDNLQRAYETNVDAGTSALEIYSNEEAFDYLSFAYTVAERLGLDGARLLALREQVGVAAARTGRLDLAEEHFEHCLEHVDTDPDRARLRYLLSLVFSSGGHNERAWVENKIALKLMGVRVPNSRLASVLLIVFYVLVTSLQSRFGWGFGRAKDEARQRHLTICRMLNAAYFTVYYMGDFVRVALCSFLRVYHGNFLGTSAEFASALATHSLLMVVLAGDRARRFIERDGLRAINMAEQLGDADALAFSQVCVGCAEDYSGMTVRGQKRAWDHLPNMVKYCIARDSGLFIGAAGITVTHRGRAREGLEKMRTWLPTMEKMGTKHYIANVMGATYVQLTILGRAREGLSYKAEQARISSQLSGSAFVQSFLYCHTIHALYEQDDFSSELEDAIGKFLELDFDHPLNRIGYLLVAYVRLEGFLRSQGQEHKASARKALWKAYRTAAYGPPLRCVLNPVHRCHLRVIKAAVAREDGRYRKALRLLRHAEDDARSSDSLWGMWVVSRERARTHAFRNELHRAREEALKALDFALREGWVLRANRLRWEFGLQTDQIAGDDKLATTMGPLKHSTAMASLASEMKFAGRRYGSAEVVRGSIVEARVLKSQTPTSTLGGTLTATISRGDLSVGRQLGALLEVNLAVSSSMDPEVQWSAALDGALRAVQGERGFLFLGDSSATLKLCRGRSATGEDLEATKYSTTVVRKTVESSEPIVVTGTDEGEALGSESAVVHDLRSIIAAPLEVRGRTLGAIYIDSRLMKGLFTGDDAVVLQAIASEIAVSLDRTQKARIAIELEAERSALEKDLELASAVQSMCLPAEDHMETETYAIAGRCFSAAQTSGDWWTYHRADGRLVILLGDVTGHGAGPAMVTASVASAFQTAFVQLRKTNIEDLLGTLNATVRNFGGGEYLMTMTCVVIDLETDLMRWYNCGGVPLIIVRGTSTITKASPSKPLGLSADPVYRSLDFELQPGDRILITSDGLLEGQPSARRRRGSGLRSLVRQLKTLSSRDIVDAADALPGSVGMDDAGTGKPDHDDDVTYVLVDRRTIN